jgi:hypothetical protein
MPLHASRLAHLIFGLCLLAPMHAWAQSLYQVEVIFFERKGLSKTLDSTLAVDGKHLAYASNLNNLTRSTQDPSAPNSWPAFTYLPPSSFKLRDQAAAIKNSRQLRLIDHQSWQQPIGTSPVNVAIAAGNAYGPHQELAGSLSLQLGKRLQLEGDLWFAQFMPNNGQALSQPLQLPNPTADTQDSSFIVTQIIPVPFKKSLNPTTATYLDHPVVGAIVYIEALN